MIWVQVKNEISYSKYLSVNCHLYYWLKSRPTPAIIITLELLCPFNLYSRFGNVFIYLYILLTHISFLFMFCRLKIGQEKGYLCPCTSTCDILVFVGKYVAYLRTPHRISLCYTVGGKRYCICVVVGVVNVSGFYDGEQHEAHLPGLL